MCKCILRPDVVGGNQHWKRAHRAGADGRSEGMDCGGIGTHELLVTIVRCQIECPLGWVEHDVGRRTRVTVSMLVSAKKGA